MFDSTDWLTLLKGIGEATKGIGQYQQNRQAASLAMANANLENKRAQDALNRGSMEAVKRNRQTQQQIGTQEAAIAQNNVAFSGTALDVLNDTERFGAFDEVTIRNNAAREAWGFKQQAQNDVNAARSYKQDANLGLIGSLATGYADTLSYRKKLQGGT